MTSCFPWAVSRSIASLAKFKCGGLDVQENHPTKIKCLRSLLEGQMFFSRRGSVARQSSRFCQDILNGESRDFLCSLPYALRAAS